MDATVLHPRVAVLRAREENIVDTLMECLELLRNLEYVRVHVPRMPATTTRLLEMEVQGDIGHCAICQEEFKVGERMVPLPCNQTHPHCFHKACIDPWIQSHNSCPVCRGKI